MDILGEGHRTPTPVTLVRSRCIEILSRTSGVKDEVRYCQACDSLWCLLNGEG
jgi:hypothetical protein